MPALEINMRFRKNKYRVIWIRTEGYWWRCTLTWSRPTPLNVLPGMEGFWENGSMFFQRIDVRWKIRLCRCYSPPSGIALHSNLNDGACLFFVPFVSFDATSREKISTLGWKSDKWLTIWRVQRDEFLKVSGMRLEIYWYRGQIRHRQMRIIGSERRWSNTPFLEPGDVKVKRAACFEIHRWPLSPSSPKKKSKEIGKTSKVTWPTSSHEIHRDAMILEKVTFIEGDDQQRLRVWSLTPTKTKIKGAF